MATADHIGQGRLGVNIVSAGLDSPAINFVDYLNELPYFAAEVLPGSSISDCASPPPERSLPLQLQILVRRRVRVHRNQAEPRLGVTLPGRHRRPVPACAAAGQPS
jgi:hypothetical protein